MPSIAKSWEPIKIPSRSQPPPGATLTMKISPFEHLLEVCEGMLRSRERGVGRKKNGRGQERQCGGRGKGGFREAEIERKGGGTENLTY